MVATTRIVGVTGSDDGNKEVTREDVRCENSYQAGGRHRRGGLGREATSGKTYFDNSDNVNNYE